MEFVDGNHLDFPPVWLICTEMCCFRNVQVVIVYVVVSLGKLHVHSNYLAFSKYLLNLYYEGTNREYILQLTK